MAKKTTRKKTTRSSTPSTNSAPGTQKSKADPTPANLEKATQQTKPGTPERIVQLIARQLDRADEAADRISREGSVVRDLRGSVIPHPAIAIELAATKLAAQMLSKHKALPQRRPRQ